MFEVIERLDDIWQVSQTQGPYKTLHDAVEDYGEECIIPLANGVYALHDDVRGDSKLAGLLIDRTKVGPAHDPVVSQGLFNDFVEYELREGEGQATINAEDFQEFLAGIQSGPLPVEVDYHAGNHTPTFSLDFYELCKNSKWEIEEHGYGEFIVASGPGVKSDE